VAPRPLLGTPLAPRAHIRLQSRSVTVDDVEELPEQARDELMTPSGPSIRIAERRPRVTPRPVEALFLPSTGWGRIDVVEADIDWDEPGEPKTGERTVPIPPRLVAILRDWTDERRIRGDGLLFRTRNGKRPAPSNWSRALKRAFRTVGHPPLRVYDCRHAAATTWLSAGVPLGTVAMRLGHSVERLVSTYVGALEGDDAISNRRIEQVIEAAPNHASGDPPVGKPARAPTRAA
jgi:hypothetical protein